MSVRPGFRRYALAIQYHGSSFLGVTKQKHEDTLLQDTTDLRGYRSVQSRLEEALEAVPMTTWENLQFSSRTDRGVHALKNTAHVDIADNSTDVSHRLLRSLNQQLRLQKPWFVRNGDIAPIDWKKGRFYSRRGCQEWSRSVNELEVLNVLPAPQSMPNPQEGTEIDWHARFSATERTYCYRVLYSSHETTPAPAPAFEWDRSWHVVDSRRTMYVEAMQEGASYLVGEQDFSSFRGSGCQRSTPVAHLFDAKVHVQPYSFFGSDIMPSCADDVSESSYLVHFVFRGDSFVYRQVRNIVGCLTEIGRGRLQAKDIPELLCARDRTLAPATAPARGLFLVDVKHGDFLI